MLLYHSEDYFDARVSKGKPLTWTLLCKATREISNFVIGKP